MPQSVLEIVCEMAPAFGMALEKTRESALEKMEGRIREEKRESGVDRVLPTRDSGLAGGSFPSERAQISRVRAFNKALMNDGRNNQNSLKARANSSRAISRLRRSGGDRKSSCSSARASADGRTHRLAHPPRTQVGSQRSIRIEKTFAILF